MRIVIVLMLFLIADAKSQGLKGEYFHGINFDYPVFSRIDKRIYFNGRLKSRGPGMRPEFFSIRWSGSVYAPKTGLYTFHVLADDGVRIWVNKTKIIDAWIEQEAAEYSGSILLSEGVTYDIRIEYFNTIIHSVLQLWWELPFESAQIFGNEIVLTKGVKTEIPVNFLSTQSEENKALPSLIVLGMKIPAKAEVATVSEHPVSQKPLKKKRPVNPTVYQPNETIILNTVVFEQSKSDLTMSAFAELDKLSDYLKRNPAFTIEIIGHTDYVGDSLDNQILSENRAKAVATYLEKNGIHQNRIFSKGLGGSNPLVFHKQTRFRSENRRVEFVLSESRN
jgi:outer membrane protein OmpA-like peptidoglycan-associated protein